MYSRHVHVSDLADAHVSAAEWLAASKPNEAFNLGSSRGYSVAEIIKASERITKTKIRTEICPRRDGDPPVPISDSTKAETLLCWKPRFPSIDDQIRHA